MGRGRLSTAGHLNFGNTDVSLEFPEEVGDGGWEGWGGGGRATAGHLNLGNTDGGLEFPGEVGEGGWEMRSGGCCSLAQSRHTRTDLTRCQSGSTHPLFGY